MGAKRQAYRRSDSKKSVGPVFEQTSEMATMFGITTRLLLSFLNYSVLDRRGRVRRWVGGGRRSSTKGDR